MKVYISGSISNNPNYREQFFKAEKHIINEFNGVKIFNPVYETCERFNDPESQEWHDLMLFCINNMVDCTHIYMLDGWKHSSGAVIEYMWAKKIGLKIVCENLGEI